MTQANDYSALKLDDTLFKLVGPLLPSAVDRLPGKITIGDYSIDSNDLLSAWVLSDKTGGHGVIDIREGIEDNRYRFATLYTRYANQWTKPFLIQELPAFGSGSVFMLGDALDNSSVRRWYATSGSTLYEDGSTNLGALNGVPTDKGVVFSGTNTLRVFYIPQGANGYSVYTATGAGRHNEPTGEKMVSFCLWDNKLIGIDTNGQLYYATASVDNAATTFTSYGADGKLDLAFTPKHLLVYYNRAGEPAIHIVTDQNVWVFDPATPRLYKIPDFESVHPKFGEAAAVWRGLMYVSSGMDVLEYNGNVVRNIGLSRDDGIPYNYQGYVKDLAAGQNSLYALVLGNTTDAFHLYGSVHEYSGLGWHQLYTHDNTASVTTILVSRTAGIVSNSYSLLWGMSNNGLAYRQSLPYAFTNPREAIDAGAFQFGFTLSAITGAQPNAWTLETGRFDAGMRGYRKIANAVQINVRNLTDSDSYVQVEYRVDNETSYTQLGSNITTNGITTLPFGTLANGIYPGLGFERIEFRFTIGESDYVSSTPAIEWAVFSFLVRKNPSWSWTATLDLSNKFMGKGPDALLAKLIALKNSNVFFAMLHRGTTYRVRIAGMGGQEELALDHRGQVQISILEIPTEPGVPT